VTDEFDQGQRIFKVSVKLEAKLGSLARGIGQEFVQKTRKELI
jgi:hypothetical protein